MKGILAALVATSMVVWAPEVLAAGAQVDPADPLPALTLGARIGPQSIYLEGDGSPSDLRGYMGGVDAALRLSHYLGIATVLEGSIYGGRSDRLEPGPAATSCAVFAELRIDTNPSGPWSFLIDVGSGYRWLALPLSSGPTNAYSGIEPLRLRVGPAFHHDKLEVSVALGVGFGWFVARGGARDCAVTGSCPDSLLDSDTASAVHFVGDLYRWPSAAGREATDIDNARLIVRRVPGREISDSLLQNPAGSTTSTVRLGSDW